MGRGRWYHFDARYTTSQNPISCTALSGCFITFSDMPLSPVLVCGVDRVASGDSVGSCRLSCIDLCD